MSNLGPGDNFEFVLKHVQGGDRVRFIQDFYGAQYAEIDPKWRFWRRKRRVRLSSDEFARLKTLLKAAN